jgi:anti-anti-sigma regulatory factor
MMRIELQDSTKTMTMRIEGRFIGKFAEDARVLITHCTKLPKLIVNLSEVSVVDSTGEEVLSWLGQLGGEFVAEKSYSLHVCERLHLPMAGTLSRSRH